MISRNVLLKKNEGVSDEDFRAAMLGDVSAAIKKMPMLRACEINFVTDRQQRSILGRGVVDIDAFIEMQYDSHGDMNASFDEAGDQLNDTLAAIAEEPAPALVTVRKFDTLVREYLKEESIIKRVSFCDRKEGVDAATFHFEWWYVHSILVKLMGGYCGYNQNLVIDRLVGDEQVRYEKLPVEGMVEFFFENMAAFDECYSSDGYLNRAGVHAGEFIGTVTTYFVEPVPVELN